jgi:hypothetical protein
MKRLALIVALAVSLAVAPTVAAESVSHGTAEFRRPPLPALCLWKLPRRTIYSRFTSISRHTCQARVLWLAAEECLGLRKTGPLSNLAGSPGRREERGASPTWDHIELNAGRLHVRRAKNGIPSTYPIRGDEIRALRRLQRETAHKCPYVFVSERAGPG